ncbi:hypothetical protein EZV62_015307 [Acer yangbiense]|uniref:Reverse transcriptase Ty1/copia-type domain-containing protein n=1 Tax=Acer yangbiense TaxID=1000413 RepID=A0A5C7HKU7_9ROSI|nr:hypothetical protein EZV62_015307 [Acer yangbiense]
MPFSAIQDILSTIPRNVVSQSTTAAQPTTCINFPLQQRLSTSFASHIPSPPSVPLPVQHTTPVPMAFHPMQIRSKSGIYKPKALQSYTSCYLANSEPSSTKLALQDPKWKRVMLDEFEALQANHTWAKKMALKTLTVDHVNSYAKIRKHGNAVIAINRDTKVKVMIDCSLVDTPRFQRFFLSYNAMHFGFVRGCRPLIGIDGCHLTRSLRMSFFLHNSFGS